MSGDEQVSDTKVQRGRRAAATNPGMCMEYRKIYILYALIFIFVIILSNQLTSLVIVSTKVMRV